MFIFVLSHAKEVCIPDFNIKIGTLYNLFCTFFCQNKFIHSPPPKKNKNKVVIGNKILWYITNNGLLRGLHRTHDSSSQ